MTESPDNHSIEHQTQSNELDDRPRRRISGTSAPSLRPSHQRILDAFDAYGAMTPDELADKIARSVFYTRPRCSELRAMGLLHPTGEVRRNALSGLKADVLTA